MKFLNVVFVLILTGGTCALAQNTNSKNQKNWRVSEAYVVLIKERAKAKGELYEAEQTHTPETLRVKTAVFRLALFNREIKKLSRINARSAARFSAAYGDLILAKIQTEAELFDLRQKFTPEYIAVKKKQIELASLNSDLKQINRNFR
ncbi:MAG: hypothetical protein M3525_02670 [Acidobacteriota bacterium]|nr:hypothetical protein [Acidobacteriota bacterium]